MQRWTGLDAVPADTGPTVVTLGNFDGVHRGHQWAVQHLIGEARARDARSVAITFDPHPLHVLHPDRAPALLSDLDQRLDHLQAAGVDATLVLRFDRALAAMTPREFVTEVLLHRLHAVAVAVGSDMRFGVRNSGDLATMRELGDELGFEVLLTPDLTVELQQDGRPDASTQAPADARDGGRRWSSSWVRELLSLGDVAAAASVLGRPHRMVGEVVHGDHRGRELGYPTANLSPDAAGMVPADGVYAGWLVRLGLPDDSTQRRLPAAISVGTNPTFDGPDRRVEAYVLDRTDLDLYGERVGVEFVERLRPTLTFDGVEPLVAQMDRDVETCREILQA